MSSPERRLPGELVFCLLLMVLGGFLLWHAYGISGFQSLASAGAFPMFAAVVMVVSAVVALVQSARKARSMPPKGESAVREFARRLLPGVLLLFTLVIAAYMALLERLGFVLSSYLFLVVSMFLLGSRRWVFNLVVAAVALTAIYGVFQTVFAVVLPPGAWLQGVWK